MKVYRTAECNCSFEINIEEVEKKGYSLDWYIQNQMIPPINLDINNISLECPLVWKMLGRGQTKGVFQLESSLGKQWTKKLKPTCIEHLAALGALLRPGCISSDTEVAIKISDREKRNINLKKITIKELYDIFQRNHFNYYGEIVSCNEHEYYLFNNKITNVTYSGEKEVFKVKCKFRTRDDYESTNYKLECTSDHKLLSYDRGWVKLEDLEIGERIAVVSRRKLKLSPKVNTLGEKNFKDICFYNYKYKCIFCDWKEGTLDVNHIDGNRKTNNHPDNLCFMCPNHHRLYTEKKITKETVIEAKEKNRLKISKDITWAEYNGKETQGIKATYDISVSGPNHNFIAGNVIVHNCLRAVDEHGISMTEHYCLRKNNLEEVDYYHPALEPILSKTYGVLTYQEQAMALAQLIAGFNLQEADVLRKAIGKKLPEEMAKCKTMFLEGAAKVKILTKEQAEEVFSWIEKSQRYSFNKSHAVSYAINGYWSAFCKAHFPVQFFTSYLYYAKDKQDPLREIQELVSDAKAMDIEIITPDITKMKSHFSTDGKTIMFGLSDVKGIGEIQVEKLKRAALQAEQTYGKKLAELTWYEFLVLLSNKVSSAVIEKLISVGAMRNLKNANIEK